MSFCSKCGAMQEASSKRCTNCGAPLTEITCPSCGAVVSADAKFCAKCGENMEEPAGAQKDKQSVQSTEKNRIPWNNVGQIIFAILLLVWVFGVYGNLASSNSFAYALGLPSSRPVNIAQFAWNTGVFFEHNLILIVGLIILFITNKIRIPRPSKATVTGLGVFAALLLVFVWGINERNAAYDEGYTDAEEHYIDIIDDVCERLYWCTPEDFDMDISQMSREEIVGFYHQVYMGIKYDMQIEKMTGRDDSYSPSWKRESALD